MNAILISIKPKHVANILNKLKTIEIRKNCPKCDLPIDVYIYCTKDSKKNIFFGYSCKYGRECLMLGKNKTFGDSHLLNGKVVAKFTLKKVEQLNNGHYYDYVYDTPTLSEEEVEKRSCLTGHELLQYIGYDDGYAWHIDDLKIFDKPMELNDFMVKPTQKFFMEHTEQTYGILGKGIFKDLTKAPQSWCYVEVEE